MLGFLNVNKPPGPTSHDVVAAVRRKCPRRVKVGHAGTLDPFACGVLVVCVGGAARLADFVQAAPKKYRAQVTLGATSSTDDPEGEITPTGAPPPSRQDVEEALKGFVGTIQQTPPQHSAVHVDGTRAYHLARQGKDLTLPARTVQIDDIQLTAFDPPRLEILVTCGSGTYIRSIARDLGERLGAGGYCSALVRTAVGAFEIEHAVALEEIDIARDLLPAAAGLGGMQFLEADDEQVALLAQGRALAADRLRALGAARPAEAGGDLSAVVDEAGGLVALIRLTGGLARPVKVFVS